METLSELGIAIKKALGRLVSATTIPLVILNMLGMIVAGIWLALLRQWEAIGVGLMLLFVSAWVFGLLIRPSKFIAAAGHLCAESGWTVGFFCFGALVNLYIYAIITIWCCYILCGFVPDITASSVIPRLLWSYGLATGPLAYMARKDIMGGNCFSSFTAYFTELAFIIIMLLIIFTPITLLTAIKVFAGLMAVALGILMTLGVLIWNEENKGSK